MRETSFTSKSRHSLLSYYLKHKSLPADHDILYTNVNSVRQKNSTNQTNSNSIKPPSIKHTIPGTNIETNIQLDYIQRIEDINLVDWVQTFRRAKNLAIGIPYFR